MIGGSDFARTVDHFFAFLKGDLGFTRSNETINGNAFYDVEFRYQETVISISYENISDQLEIIIFKLENGKLPDFNDRTRRLPLNQLTSRVMTKVDQQEIKSNNAYFLKIKAASQLERKLLKRAKDLRLVLTRLNELLQNEGTK